MNEQTFNQTLNQQQQRIYSLALYILRDKHEAEDVTQDVFTRLWHNTTHLKADKIVPWLSAVTRNACIDKIRQRRAFSEVTEEDQVTKTKQEPDGSHQQDELSEYLNTAISKLKEPYCSLIRLCDVQQSSHSFAAESLNLSMTQVKVYLHRARQQLKELLKEFIHE